MTQEWSFIEFGLLVNNAAIWRCSMQLLIVGVSEQLCLLVTVCIFMADLQEISQGLIFRKCCFQSVSFLSNKKQTSDTHKF